MSAEVKFEPFQRVLVRDNDNQYWKASFFSHEFECDVPRMYHTVCGAYRQCIPYNEETAHLLGTGKSPTSPEPEFQMGDHVEVRDVGKNSPWHPAVFLWDSDDTYVVIRKGEQQYTNWFHCRHANW